ncbi:hypothetical protein J7438_10355 [Thalassotalea sp. G20_0]|uniref:hypothetical protein n=1 Tax=Thalassotalea sp. G20_0 TaxID=2821093 RepID=UPI001ADCEF01|nr:hypothetical protein [Thalassotalea sp. G20_0]MBO9494486.1 hypothetical protein [Thalassotalea sp. G20_0]
MKTMKLFAVSLIAAAVSVSALADIKEAKEQIDVSAYVKDMIMLEIKNNSNVELTYEDPNNPMGGIVGSAEMVVRMRHADVSPRRYELTIKPTHTGGSGFIVQSEGGDQIPMMVKYKHGGQGLGYASMTPNTPVEYKTSNGLRGEVRTSLDFVIQPDDHYSKPAGTYKNNLTLTIAAR